MSDREAAALIAAAAEGDRRAFGDHLVQVLESQALNRVNEALVVRLAPLVSAHVRVTGHPSEQLPAIRDVTRELLPAVDRVLPVNAVVLEHVLRSTRGLSDFLAVIDPAFVTLYGSLVAGALAAAVPARPARPTPTPVHHDALQSWIAPTIRVAIAACVSGDDTEWRTAVASAVQRDTDEADRAAASELARRLARAGKLQDFNPESLIELIQLSEILAAAVAGGPFAVPTYLFELAMRRARHEPGCSPVDNVALLVEVQTAASALLDLRHTLAPPGWTGHLVAIPAD